MTEPRPLRVLLVEDEALLAMDLEAVLADEGHAVVGEAVCARSAEALPDTAAPDLAFVDVHLAHGTSGLDVCRMIRRRWPGALVVFVTANPKRVPADHAGPFGIIAKPFSTTMLVSALRFLEEGLHRPPPSLGPPPSLVMSADLRAAWTG